MQVNLWVYVYTAVSCTKEHCTMYTTTTYACIPLLFFFKEKHCTLIVYITEFSLKIGGAKYINGPPPIWNLGGGAMAPPAPPIADPMI